MSGLGAIVTTSAILAIVIVVFWRQILIFCVIFCLAIIFAAVLGMASGATRLLTRPPAAPGLSAVWTIADPTDLPESWHGGKLSTSPHSTR